MIHPPLTPKKSPIRDVSAPQFSSYSKSSPEHEPPSKKTSTTVPIIPRKACNECRRNHKRCDKKLPSCTRCASRGCLCVYSERKKPGKITKPKKTVNKLQPKIVSAKQNVEIKSENFLEPNQPPDDV